MEEVDDALGVGLRLVTQFGLNPRQNSRYGRFMRLTALMASAVYVPLVFRQMTYAGNDVDTWVATFEVSMTFNQLILKASVLVLFKKDLARLLDTLEGLRSLDDIPLSEEVKDEIGFINKFAYYCSQAFKLGAYINAVAYLLRNVGNVPFGVIKREGSSIGWFYFVYAWGVYTCWMTIPVVAGYDDFFLGLCTKVAVHYKLLRYAFEHIEPKEVSVGLIAKYVDYHNVLLRCEREILRIFSFSMLNQYVISVTTICVELYVADYMGKDLATKISCYNYVSILLCELGFYCMIPSILEHLSERLADSVYCRDWSSKEYKKFIPDLSFIIMRAQQPIEYMAGGMIKMQAGVYIKIVNTAISVLTLLRSKRDAF